MQKRRNVAIFVTAILICCLTMSIVSGMIIANQMAAENREKDIRVTAAMVCNAIANSFLRPITVSETMSKDAAMRQYLREKDSSRVESNVAEYLKSIRDGFGYSMVFAVSDITKNYFTFDGIFKQIDPKVNEHDEWYSLFLESGKDYDLDVDTDEASSRILSVFVNRAVYDEDNRFLGVCGVSMGMEHLIHELNRYERVYQIKINLIDENGLIQVDTQNDRIERDSIQIPGLENMADGEYYYENQNGIQRVVTYIDALDWYMVIDSDASYEGVFYRILSPCLYCFGAGVLLSMLVLIYWKKTQDRYDKEQAHPEQ